ncbi:prolyl oligopeptidase family serine peptidase [Duganella sp. sic0402]|uniref:prolyl oligopeptidase family serine peptidase n=1 Tax=Duganella sp. sic0402 TaxID=2854786 RepID=UPI001C453CB5|nr:prolyl oligopeptidase family serine peptidase [Duganella sp. sic0402]MBV7538630.1 prolyl oligopeptidase family serine peptidase [Duganella sp. sic0402]
MNLYQKIASMALLALALPRLASAQDSDPYQWLEEVRGERQMQWVAGQNTTALRELQSTPEYEEILHSVRTALNTSVRLPEVTQHGRFLYNFLIDAEHQRGVWRRTTMQQYQRQQPAWETIIDVDQLAARENEKWVWHDAQCLYPQARRCLILLSRGGGDAHVVREFDTVARRFIEDGFRLPEAKSEVSWIDQNTLLVGTDFGAGTLTASGYARVVKEWKRGTPLAEARTLYEGAADDMRISAHHQLTAGEGLQFVTRTINFYRSELFWRDHGTLRKLPVPDDAQTFVLGGQLAIQLNSDWDVNGKRYPQGALLATDLRRLVGGERQLAVLFTPTPASSLDGVTVTRGALLLNILDNVRNRLVEVRRVGQQWRQRKVDAPAFGQLEASALDPLASDDYILKVTDFLNPTTTYLGRIGNDQRTLLKAMPAYFDASAYKVQQFHAASKDGTQVPYFVVMSKQARLDGGNPTLLNGYGGFQIPMKPHYLGPMGDAWLKHGGVYVLANIRGGGEFGPSWHQAAVKQNRQRAYDDFLAVAEDLIQRKITSPRHLGISGRSNGGLLVGVAFTQRPDLFNAVICGAPLLDMQRFTKLLAGPSWMAEYGDPDDPAQWAYLSKYSPYQNVLKDRHYPRVLFTTSTSDDRVHPGHARKMAARMEEQGHDVLYWENTEGGHSVAASIEQEVQWWAATYSFLLKQLK